MTDDAELLAFCEAEHGRLVGLLTLYVGDRPTAEELAQEALVRACARWPEVRSKRNPAAWVTRVAVNLANSTFRRRRAARRAMARHGAADAYVPADPADAIAVRQAVAELPPRQREAIVHRYFGGLDVAATAEVMGTGESNVRALTARGIDALRSSGLLVEEGRA